VTGLLCSQAGVSRCTCCSSRVSRTGFGDTLLVDQGLLSRVLAVMPDPVAGSRFYRELEAKEISRISNFSSRVEGILQTRPRVAEADPRELRPRPLGLSPDARRLWIDFHDHIEELIAPNGALVPIKSLANKAPEHAARLAAVIEAFENLSAQSIAVQRMMGGIKLIEHYLNEALRIYASIQDCPELKLAEMTLDWLRHWPDDAFSARDLYQFGPSAIREATKAKNILELLRTHGWITQLEGGAIVKGVKRRDAFRLLVEARG
jgi:hypothetical protein